MKQTLNQTYFFQNACYAQVLNRFFELTEADIKPDTRHELCYNTIGDLAQIAQEYGLRAPVWKNFICMVIALSDNAISRACEAGRELDQSFYQLALHDLTLFFNLFNFDFESFDVDFAYSPFAFLYKTDMALGNGLFDADSLSVIEKLQTSLSAADSPDAFTQAVICFYKQFGAGKFSIFKAFRLSEQDPFSGFVPVSHIMDAKFSDLVGYEEQKSQLIQNTEQFLAGRDCNNVMLFGDSGTGKSTCIKATLNTYWRQGLRMIEVYKHQICYIPELIEQIKNRAYKFIIYLDDLSFEDNETQYKYLKAIMEGGLEGKPSNILLYATSNRRHLIHESWKDRSDMDEDIHHSDTLEEKLSLSYRFGLSIYFSSPTPQEFREIVRSLAARYGIVMDEDQLFREAHRWELHHGNLSGRTAQQFVNHLSGKIGNLSSD